MILIQLGLTRKPVEGLDEGSDVDFFLIGSTLRPILSFLSLDQPRTSHEY